MIYTLQIKNEWTRNVAWKRRKVCAPLQSANLMRRGRSKDVGLSERIILKWVSEKAI